MVKPKVSRTCCAAGCTNNSQGSDSLRFHGFPKDPEIKRKWVALICDNSTDRPWSPTANSKLCSVHFTQDSYHQNLRLLEDAGICTKRARLRSDALPTLFLPKRSSPTQDPTSVKLRQAETGKDVPTTPSRSDLQNAETVSNDTIDSDAVSRDAVVDYCGGLVLDVVDDGVFEYGALGSPESSASEDLHKSDIPLTLTADFFERASGNARVNRACRAFRCRNNPQRNPELRFHRFPKNEELRRRWIDAAFPKALGRPWSPTSHSTLCSEHFAPDCYQQNLEMLKHVGLSTKHARLKSDAVPTVFKHQASAQATAVGNSHIKVLRLYSLQSEGRPQPKFNGEG